MYDRQTESLWAHFNGEALAGVFAGDELDRLPVQTIAWSSWLAEHPDGLVLSRDTGEDRDYGRNPYQGYDDPDSFPFLFDGEELDFERTDDGFVDDRTGSRWNVLGRATDGPLEGTQLDAIEHVDTFGFAWAAFSHDTRVLPEN